MSTILQASGFQTGFREGISGVPRNIHENLRYFICFCNYIYKFLMLFYDYKEYKAVPQYTYGEYSSYSYTTSTLDGVNDQSHVPAALYPPGKFPEYALYRRLGGPQSRFGHRG
jgi:hypothetical protein